MAVLVEMGKEDEFQTSAKHHAVQVIFFFVAVFAFLGWPKIRKKQTNQKTRSENHFSASWNEFGGDGAEPGHGPFLMTYTQNRRWWVLLLGLIIATLFMTLMRWLPESMPDILRKQWGFPAVKNIPFCKELTPGRFKPGFISATCRQLKFCLCSQLGEGTHLHFGDGLPRDYIFPALWGLHTRFLCSA